MIAGLRYSATNQKVVDSNPDDVIGYFNGPNPLSCTISVGETQPLIELSTRNLSGSRGWLPSS
jgi:hypothetical protein